MRKEGLREQGADTSQCEPFLVELCHLVEVELSFQIPCLLLPLSQSHLKLLLLLDESDGVDTLVHTNGVLPVVRAIGILRVIFDTYSLVSTHMAQHDLLFDATDLYAGSIDGIMTLLDTIAAEVAAGRAGITHDHREVARLITVHRHLCP